MYSVLLAGEDFDLNVNDGNANSFILTLDVNPGSKDGIPSGVYTMMDFETADDLPINTCWKGIYNAKYGGFMGCWFFRSEDSIEGALKEGQVKVTNKGNNSYIFEIDMKDGYGHAVKATYDGKVFYSDNSDM